MRRLIINADDFGLTQGVNQAIVETHKNGVVSSATMMANASALKHALQVAHSTPSLGLGCHIVLIDGTPVLPPEQIPDLIEAGTGHFHRKLSTFLQRILLKLVDPEQIEAEATAQIRKLQSAGVHLSHLDSHKHTHMFPHVLDPMLRAARLCSISAIRNPFEPIALSLLRQGPRIYKRWIEVTMLRGFSRNFLRQVQQAGMFTTSGAFGIAATGILDQSVFNAIVSQLPEGSWEFVCHPGYNDADLQSTSTRLLESRFIEFQTLTSAETRLQMEQRGIELISYRNLA